MQSRSAALKDDCERTSETSLADWFIPSMCRRGIDRAALFPGERQALVSVGRARRPRAQDSAMIEQITSHSVRSFEWMLDRFQALLKRTRLLDAIDSLQARRHLGNRTAGAFSKGSVFARGMGWPAAFFVFLSVLPSKPTR